MCTYTASVLAQGKEIGEEIGRKVGEEIGEKRGKIIGEGMLAELIHLLMDENDYEAVRRVTADESAREELYVKYGITGESQEP